MERGRLWPFVKPETNRKTQCVGLTPLRNWDLKTRWKNNNPNNMLNRYVCILIMVLVMLDCACSNTEDFHFSRRKELPLVVFVESINDDKGMISFENGGKHIVSWGAVTDGFRSMGLHYGDIIIVKKKADSVLLPKKMSWLTGFCHANQVGLYYEVIGQSGKVTGDSDVFHWIGDFNKSTEMKGCNFYVNDIFVGKGSNGYIRWVDLMKRKRGEEIYIVSPRTIDWDDGAGFQVPYSSASDSAMLKDALATNHISLKVLTEILLP